MKTLVIGLDGATFDLIEPWVAAGKLPTFARLMQTGSYGRLRSVPNTDTAPAWASFATGLSPANHGLFNELGWTADRRTLRPQRGADRQGTSFWQRASDAGKRVVVVNAPFTYPAEPINGVMVAGIDAPGEDAPGFCHPPEFIAAVRQRFGDYRIDSQITMAIKEGRPEEGLARAYAIAERHTETFLYALDQAPWQLGVLVYSIPDEMQHFFWQQMATNSGPQREAILHGYQFIERQIARLLAHAGDDTTLIVLSDHGFGPLCATPEYLAGWLAAQGALRYLNAAKRPLRQRLTSAAYGMLRQRLGEQHKHTLRRVLPQLRNRVESDARFAGIDWSTTTAFVGPSPCEIWINTQGREPQGIVAPGEEYERMCDELIAALLAWRDAQGRQVVRAARRRAAMYAGRDIANAPDITIEWNPEAAPPAAALPGNLSRFDADHQPEGILIVAGPGVAGGKRIADARLEDIAPTVLHLLAVSPTAQLDGQALTLFSKKGAVA